jgi:hypothetical protein
MGNPTAEIAVAGAIAVGVDSVPDIVRTARPITRPRRSDVALLRGFR